MMRNLEASSNAQARGVQVANEPSQPQYQQIKLAMDVHAPRIVGVRMIDGAKSQPPQTSSNEIASEARSRHVSGL
jgi:hypothetical protein